MSVAKRENLTSNSNHDTKTLMNKKWDHIFGTRFVTGIDISKKSRDISVIIPAECLWQRVKPKRISNPSVNLSLVIILQTSEQDERDSK